MRSFLTRLAPRGPTLLALGVLLGLAFPALAEWARPLMPVTIFLIALGTLLRIDVEAVFAALKRPSLSIFLPTMVMVASPALAGAAIYTLPRLIAMVIAWSEAQSRRKADGCAKPPFERDADDDPQPHA
jgi:BASS family bile acid:Na+ symporter